MSFYLGEYRCPLLRRGTHVQTNECLLTMFYIGHLLNKMKELDPSADLVDETKSEDSTSSTKSDLSTDLFCVC